MILPRALDHVHAPPVKIQGIKTALVPMIARSLRWDGAGRWVEPFCGSCVVALNLRPPRALLADANPCLIRLMQAIATGALNPGSVRTHLEENGHQLLERGEAHYYEVRERFNQTADPHNFLFLNRACFNGLIRFNRQGAFNVPFCRKPDRFRPGYVTRIVNQVAWVQGVLAEVDWTFVCQDWRDTLAAARPGDFVYLDPPYAGRSTDYYAPWSADDPTELAARAGVLPCGVAASTWLENRFRRNDHLERSWSGMARVTTEHFYHVGASARNRHPMTEVLLIAPEHLAPDHLAPGQVAPDPSPPAGVTPRPPAR